MNSPEYEKGDHKDETGFSEKQIDIAIEKGIYKSKKTKVKKAKILFENKAKKW